MPIEVEILRYLADHPGANDTLEGIVGWWMRGREVAPTSSEIKSALEPLVAQRLVIAEQGADGRVRYRAAPPSDGRRGRMVTDERR